MAKQAVALLVHQNPEQVNNLISLLEKDFDIYIHIDKKSAIEIASLNCKNVWKQVEVKWGGFGMVEATMLLYKKIIGTDIPYTHVILLSGDSLPVKSTDHISAFLNDNPGVSFLENVKAGEVTLERRRLIWYNSDFRKKISGLQRLLYPLMFVRALQRRFKWYRSTKGFERTGSQWTILAMEHLQHLVNHCNLPIYKTVAVPDESFVQDHFYNNNIAHSENLIYANWSIPRGYSPEFIDESKHKFLLDSKYLFARKYKPA